MSSITLTVSDEVKAELKKFSWVNWSEVAREVMKRQEKLREEFEVFKSIISKSKLSESDALAFGKEVKQSMHKRYKRLYPELS